MKTTLVNLWGGPGSGKSTMAAKLFHEAKEAGRVVELVQEAAKESAWHKQAIVQEDVFFEQARRISRLLGKVEVIYNDSPVELSAFYDPDGNWNNLIISFNERITDAGHSIEDIWIARTKKYEPKGRFQTEEAARAIDDKLQAFFTLRVLPMDDFANNPRVGFIKPEEK